MQGRISKQPFILLSTESYYASITKQSHGLNKKLQRTSNDCIANQPKIQSRWPASLNESTNLMAYVSRSIDLGYVDPVLLTMSI
jgi:hypothetical protein